MILVSEILGYNKCNRNRRRCSDQAAKKLSYNYRLIIYDFYCTTFFTVRLSHRVYVETAKKFCQNFLHFRFITEWRAIHMVTLRGWPL